MDQISPPMRIVLAVAIVFAAAYMLVLKPSDEAPAPAPAPATAPAAEAGGPEANSALGKSVEKAREAANATEAAQQAGSGETQSSTQAANAPSTTQAAPDAPAAKPAPAQSDAADGPLDSLPKWLATSMDKQVVAVLFSNGESADDRRTTKSLNRAYDYDGEVVTRVVNVKKISDYQAIAEGVDVSQSPTLMVIARDRSAVVLAGYSSLNTINQAIIDARLVTDNPLDDVKYFKVAQRECRTVLNKSIIGVTEGTTPAGAAKNLDAVLDSLNASLITLSKTKAPKAYKPQKALLERWLRSERSLGKQVRPILAAKVYDPIKFNNAVAANDKLYDRTTLEMNAVGVSTCN